MADSAPADTGLGAAPPATDLPAAPDAPPDEDDDEEGDDGAEKKPRPKRKPDKQVQEHTEPEDDIVRRWEVSLTDLKFRNDAETFDPYLLIKFGGRFEEEEVEKKASPLPGFLGGGPGGKFQVSMLKEGTPVSLRTETKNGIKMDVEWPYKRKFKLVYYCSYAELKRHQVTFFVYDYDWFSPDGIVGKCVIPLIDIANGDINHDNQVEGEKDLGGDWKDDPENPGKQIYEPNMQKVVVGNLKFTCFMQEVGNFRLKFTNWRGQKLKGVIKPMFGKAEPTSNPCLNFKMESASYIKFGLMNGNYWPNLRSCSSSTQYATTNPLWEEPGEINFFGTRSQFEAEVLQMKVTSPSQTPSCCACRSGPPPLGDATILMRGLLDNGYILTQLVNKEWVIDEFDELQYDNKTIEHKKIGKWEHIQRGKIEGEVAAIQMPKYRQVGEPFELKDGLTYLGVKIARANVQGGNPSRPPNTWFLLEWDNIKLSTAVLPSNEPVYNETVFFHVRLKDGFGPDQLHAKGPLVISCFDKEESGSNDFLGKVEVMLHKITNSHNKGTEGIAYNVKMFRGKNVKFGADLDADPDAKGGSVEFRAWFQGCAELQRDDFILDDSNFDPVILIPKKFKKRRKEWVMEINKHISKPRRLKVPSVNGKKFDPWPRLMQCWGKNENFHEKFFPEFIVPMTSPNKYSDPLSLVRMVHLIGFQSDSEVFYSPDDVEANSIFASSNFVLDARKGDQDEHNLLLASLLLGLSKVQIEESKVENLSNDVYVCIGHNMEGDHHTWLMSRNKDKSCTFLEILTETFYNLPARWEGPTLSKAEKKVKDKLAKADANVAKKEAKSKEKELAKAEFADKKAFKQAEKEAAKEEKALRKAQKAALKKKRAGGSSPEDDEAGQPGTDIVEQEDVELEERTGFEAFDPEELIVAEMMTHFDNEGNWDGDWGRDTDEVLDSNLLDFDPFAAPKEPPNRGPSKVIVEKSSSDNDLRPDVPLELPPYYAIDVVFNQTNLWGNLQHHNPLNVSFDMEDDTQWWPFVTSDWCDKLYGQQEVKSFFDPQPLAPSMPPAAVASTEANLLDEIQMGVNNIRSGSNKRTTWDSRMSPIIANWLEAKEEMKVNATLDSKSAEAKGKGDKLRKRIIRTVPANNHLMGTPVCFCTTDVQYIRKYLLNEFTYHEAHDEKFLRFVAAVKIVPYPNYINAVWVFLGNYEPVMAAATDGVVPTGIDTRLKSKV